MADLNATELASRLAVSKARISQYLSEGKLAGCYQGDGRQRRYDLDKVAAALGRNLNPGQMLGNGAATRAALKDVGGAEAAPAASAVPRVRPDSALPLTDPDRYELARTQKAEEEARRLRRQNLADEGAWVVAAEVERQTGRLLSQEIAQVEVFVRDAARAVADQFGLDFRTVRKSMMDEWRRYRAARAAALGAQATDVPMAEHEDEANI